MARSLLSTRPRASHGVHRFRNIRLYYCQQYLSGFHVLLDLRRLGMKDRDILPCLQYLERQTAKRMLRLQTTPTDRIQ